MSRGVRDPDAREALDRFASRLRDARREQGLRQRDVAKWLGVWQGVVCSWEAGRTAPSHERLVAWAALLGVEVPPGVAGWTLDPCGTHGGWARHRNHRETPCGPCVAARHAYDVARRTADGGVRINDISRELGDG